MVCKKGIESLIWSIFRFFSHREHQCLEHLHPLAATGTPTGAGPVPNRVPGRGSRQPPHRSHSGSRQTLNSALNTVHHCWELPIWDCQEFGVRKWPLHPRGQGAKFGMAGPVSTVAAQNPRGGPLVCPLAPTMEMLLSTHFKILLLHQSSCVGWRNIRLNKVSFHLISRPHLGLDYIWFAICMSQLPINLFYKTGDQSHLLQHLWTALNRTTQT